MKVNEEEIASLMPQIYRKLEWLDKEDIIKRVVSLEFNRMIDYYKDADEIQQVDERSSRSERGERRAHAAEEGYSRFFLNFGKADGLYPNQLIELVNKCVPGKVRIGKIDLRENFSFFEVEEGEAQRVMDSMNGFEVDGRRISVEPAQGKKKKADAVANAVTADGAAMTATKANGVPKTVDAGVETVRTAPSAKTNATATARGNGLPPHATLVRKDVSNPPPSR